MLQQVIKHGAVCERERRRIQAPAADKTGTNEGGGFAGFTLWRGFDKKEEWDLTGAQAA